MEGFIAGLQSPLTVAWEPSNRDSVASSEQSSKMRSIHVKKTTVSHTVEASYCIVCTRLPCLIGNRIGPSEERDSNSGQ